MTEDTPVSTRSGHNRPARNWAGWIALVIAIVSLLLNVILILGLLRARDATLKIVADGLNFVDDLEAKGLEFNFPISQTLRIDEDFPLKLDLDFPINAKFPINTVISIPVNLGPIGSRIVVIPINTTVPVSLTVPVHIDRAFPIDLPLSIQITVPIRLAPDQPPLEDWLALAREKLLEVQRQIEGGLK